jgi:hypothetical protein
MAPAHTNHLGWPIHPLEEGVENFHAWFAGSKIKDIDGRPLVVFHGTGRAFDAFNTDQNGILGFGAYFTGCPTDASEYAYAEDGGEQVIPVYLSITNPVRVRAEGGWQALYEMIYGKPPRNSDDDMPGERQAKRMLQMLQEWGHDGIISHGVSPAGPLTHYVAFSPGQIKSAIGNSGKFDPNSPSLTDRIEDQPALLARPKRSRGISCV